jgi:CxxC-x17-CxxC domain-containing protein
MYQDRQLTCRDCGATFTFTAGEQEFYASRGLMNAPRRCPDCRRAAKQTRGDSAGGGRGGYDRNGGGGGGGYGGGYERGPRQMTDAICAQCGSPTQVPFTPRGDRPVYCSDCFAQQRGGSYSGSR